MRALSPEEAEVLRLVHRARSGDDLDDVRPTMDRLAVRGCLGFNRIDCGGYEDLLWFTTDLGRLALRVAVQPPAVVL